jgi:hypothetical protein
LQEWVQQQQHQASPADSSWPSSSLADNAQSLEGSVDSDFLLFPTLFSGEFEFDFTTTTLDANLGCDISATATPAMGVSSQSNLDDILLPSGIWPPYPMNGEVGRTTTSPTSSSGSSTAQTKSYDTFLSTPAATESASTKSSPNKRAAHDPADAASRASPPSTDERVHKRQRNTEAARRYRQRKVDRLTELEEALASMTQERDDLKLKLAKSEAEADVLRSLVGKRG